MSFSYYSQRYYCKVYQRVRDKLINSLKSRKFELVLILLEFLIKLCVIYKESLVSFGNFTRVIYLHVYVM